MKKLWILMLSLFLFQACGGDKMAGVKASLAAKDFGAARRALGALIKDEPGVRAPHYYLFVLDRFEFMQGDAARQAFLSQSMVAEYDWITAKEGLARNYSDMEPSLQSGASSRTLYHEARQAIYGER
jgi:hypothetical protein